MFNDKKNVILFFYVNNEKKIEKLTNVRKRLIEIEKDVIFWDFTNSIKFVSILFKYKESIPSKTKTIVISLSNFNPFHLKILICCLQKLDCYVTLTMIDNGIDKILQLKFREVFSNLITYNFFITAEFQFIQNVCTPGWNKALQIIDQQPILNLLNYVRNDSPHLIKHRAENKLSFKKIFNSHGVFKKYPVTRDYILLPKRDENRILIMFLFNEKIMFLFKGDLCFENAGLITELEINSVKTIFATFSCKYLILHFECLTQFNDVYKSGFNIPAFYENIINLYLIGVGIEDRFLKTLTKLTPTVSESDMLAMLLNKFSTTNGINKHTHEFFNFLEYTNFRWFSSKIFYEIPSEWKTKLGQFFKYNKFIYKNKSTCKKFVEMYQFNTIYMSRKNKKNKNLVKHF